MVTSEAATPDDYVASLPDDRRAAVTALRDTINANLPDGFEEGMLYRMLGWYVPLERFGNTYNGQPLGLVGVASQKGYISLYLNSVYGDRDTEAWFKARYAESGKKLNMGKSCVRFRSVEEIPLDVIGETIARVELDSFVAHYEAARGSSRQARGGD
jgi:hypothetical protein